MRGHSREDTESRCFVSSAPTFPTSQADGLLIVEDREFWVEIISHGSAFFLLAARACVLKASLAIVIVIAVVRRPCGNIYPRS